MHQYKVKVVLCTRCLTQKQRDFAPGHFTPWRKSPRSGGSGDQELVWTLLRKENVFCRESKADSSVTKPLGQSLLKYSLNTQT